MKTDAILLKNIKVVGFDFDDTLVDEQYSIKKRWQKVLGEFPHLSSRLGKVFFKIYKKRGPLYKFHVNDTLRELGIGQNITEEIMEKFLSSTGDELLMKGASELLKFLKEKRVIIGIITDGKQSYQEGRLKRAGIYDCMDFIYYGLGKREQKPAKGVLEDIISRFSIKSLDEFLFVGNDYINDVEGMLSSGAKTCLVPRDKWVSRKVGLLVVENLKELLNIFKKYE